MDIVERLRVQYEHGILNIPEDHEFVGYDEAANEIDRLRKQLRYQEHRDGRIGTHDPVCYGYGPSHYECALREIERLREALQNIVDLKVALETSVWTISDFARATLKENQ